ncbi:ATP-binding protein [Thermobifida halotolerans]|uniref:ATP-binding protein n=1 Tax=Thermobifida halotolerans TaxID=483545 RepID=A0A399G1B1_9ACTN|nr:ATP-binding protein [Thermobifida halotolerans]UOE19382.1 ATP-binding protein [Thermobifida halotolerans]
MSVAFTSFPGLPTSVAAARRFVAGILRACPEATAPEEVVDRAELITSELCTNALRHTRSGDPGQTFTVWIRVDEHGVRGEVHTEPVRLPHLVPQVVESHPWCESGRGLFLVDQLATKWGTLSPWENGVYFLLAWPQPR